MSAYETVFTPDDASWRTLRLVSAYRLCLAAALFFVFYLDLPPAFLGEKYPALYLFTSLLYFCAAILLLLLTHWRWTAFYRQCTAQLLFDVMLLAVLIHASGGLQTGLGALLIVVVVAGGALVPGRLAVFIAAFAALAVLFEASHAYVFEAASSFTQAGLLGAIFFMTTLLANWLSRVVKHSQSLAEQRGQDLLKLATLNQHIISRIQTAVLVLDQQGRVTLMNASAQKLLDLDNQRVGFNLKQTLPELADRVARWRTVERENDMIFQLSENLPEMSIRVTRLDSGETLIFLENTTALAQQAQQLKLASLGRLTASIAHEIRNPLSAISHAGELLAEQSVQDQQMIHKLTEIIHRHSQRVNNIIETILQMSRKKTVNPTSVLLATWLERFVEEFAEVRQLPADRIKLLIKAPLAKVMTDPDQLHQVMWNLLENATHFADLAVPAAIRILLDKNTDIIFIDVMDNGPGVPEKALPHLFEPFNSGRTGGTGLGLYLAQELCQANGARLHYLPLPVPRFRISYAMDGQELIQ